jgi:hypothetical protein
MGTKNGEYFINMYGKFQTYSISGVLLSMYNIQKGEMENLPVAPSEFRDKVIFIGASAAGVEDLKSTPMGSATPGVFLHASIFGNITTGDFLQFKGLTINFVFLFLIIIMAAGSTGSRRQKQNFTNIQSNLTNNDIDLLTININDSDRTYFFGPSYAYQFSSSLSIGGSLYVYYRDKELIRNQILLFEQGQHYLLNYYETSTDWGYRPILGIMWEPIEKISFGFTLSKIYITSSENETQLITKDTTLDNPDIIGSVSYDYSNTDTIYFGDSNNKNKGDFPLTLSFGMAYFVSPKLLFSGDIVYSEEIAEKGSVVNFSIGTEYYFSEKYAIRAGFYSDYANTPDLSSGFINQTENIDLYSASLSFTVYHSSAGITLGCLYGFGDGDAQIISNSAVIQDVEISNLAVYLSANYNY